MFPYLFRTNSDSSGRIVSRSLASDPVTVVAIAEDLMPEATEDILVAVSMVVVVEAVMAIPPAVKSMSEMFVLFSVASLR